MEQSEKKLRGFAAISQERKREIARKGGIAAHRKIIEWCKNCVKKGAKMPCSNCVVRVAAHEFSREEAQRAGRLGGRARHKKTAE